MLLKLKSGRVEGYTGAQDEIVYLVADLEEVAKDHDFVFTDGHALATLSTFYDSLDYLESVDWGMVNQRYWRDNADDNDRMRRKQAEFLVHQSVPLACITEVGVMSVAAQTRVIAIMGAVSNTYPQVNVRSAWYY